MKLTQRLFRREVRHFGALLLGVAAGACDDGTPSRGSPAPGRTDAFDATALDSAARTLIAFLQGRQAFPDTLLADTVTLQVAPDGGGGSVRVPREQLRDPSGWRVRSERATYRLAPPAGATRLTTMPGTHFDCFEQPLVTRAPELAPLPHVGAKLEPPDASSCLQVWNVTFVFDSTPPRRLVAAVYDQFEW